MSWTIMHQNCNSQALPSVNINLAQFYTLFLSPTIQKTLIGMIIEKNLVCSSKDHYAENDIIVDVS